MAWSGRSLGHASEGARTWAGGEWSSRDLRCVGTGDVLATAHDVVLDELIAGKAIQKSPVSPPDYGRAYDRLCEAYKGIDEFRLKLLGLLLLASSGIFLLADKAERDPA